LAQEARKAGYDVSPDQVHRWRVDRLLPDPVVRTSAGRAGFRTHRRAGAREQLVALCEFRSRTRDKNRIAILLWLSGWEIASERVVEALLALLPEVPDASDVGDEQLDEVSRFALSGAAEASRRLGRGRLKKAVVADAADLLLSIALGQRPFVDQEAAQRMEQAVGLSQRDGTTASPWTAGASLPASSI
jgi:hypothetical protein